MANMAWVAAGVTSTGGVSALVVSSFRGKKQQPTIAPKNEEYSESNAVTESDKNHAEGGEDGEQ
jgi:hypothetical protein